MSQSSSSSMRPTGRTRKTPNPWILVYAGFLLVWTVRFSCLSTRDGEMRKTFAFSVEFDGSPSLKGRPTLESSAMAAWSSDQSNTPKVLLEDYNNNNNITNHRTVEFLQINDFFSHGDLYSGMWWQDRESFLQTTFHVDFLEAATLDAFANRPNPYKVQMAVDWMDLSVEHLSKYVKHFVHLDDGQHVAHTAASVTPQQQRLVEILTNYVDRAQAFDLSSVSSPQQQQQQQLAVHRTLVIVPLKASTKKYHDSNNHKYWTQLQLAATLASLWKVGMRRVVVVGVSTLERQIAEAAFDQLRETKKQSTMDVVYVECTPNRTTATKNVPRLALQGLQLVLNKTASGGSSSNNNHDTRWQWLGPNPDQWQYVYYTEPDLLLQTRPSALPALTEALRTGNLLAAHRLEPIPHQRDYPNDQHDRMLDQLLVPDLGVFASVTELNSGADSCCDQGTFYPANHGSSDMMSRPAQVRLDGQCLGIWVHCGFGRGQQQANYSDPVVAYNLHYRLWGYPFFSLRNGLGIPLVAANQRVCVPRKGPALCRKKT